LIGVVAMANDLSFNVIALDKASATFVKAAGAIDRFAAKMDELDGKEAKVSVNVKADESTKALDSFTTRFALMSAGIVAASPAIGAAILGGVGAGFIGIAALALKSNKDVQAAYSSLWQGVVTETKSASAQLVPQFVGAAGQMGAAAQRLGPQLQAGFSAAGPDIAALTRGVVGFATNAMPGVVSSMQNSLPLFSASANAMGTLGTAFGSAVQSVGQHSAEYGSFMQSLASITSSALGLAVSLVNDIASVWSQNSGIINSAVSSTAQVISGLAQGVLPVLSFALGTAANALATISSVLGPVAPILGGVAAGALALWGAFKAAGAIKSVIKSFADAVLDAGTAAETNAAKAATMIAAHQGVAVSASAAASAVQASGVRASSAALSFGTMASSLAGPIGIGLTVATTLLGLFSSGTNDAANSSTGLKTSLDGVTSALQASNGAVNGAVVGALQAEQKFKDAADATAKFGISQSSLASSILQGGPALDQLRSQLQEIIKANTQAGVTAGRAGTVGAGLNDVGRSASDALKKLNDLSNGYGTSTGAAQENGKALQENASKLVQSTDGQEAASGAAQSFGLNLGVVSAGFSQIATTSKDANIGVAAVAEQFGKNQLATVNAQAAITTGFAQADKAVVQAKTAVTSASRSVEQASRSVADAQHQEATAARAVVQAQQGVQDAQHGVVTAERAVKDAVAGVTTARKAYVQAQQDDIAAERALSDARQQAIRDLKAMHLQLDDQYTSEASARVRLFDAQQTATGLGVTSLNARSIAGQTVTTTNEPTVKAAIDLLSAQNGLNSALNTGVNLRQDVAVADAAGVNGAANVVSAQKALISAQDQVTSSSQGIVRAQQQVSDANYGLSQANRNLQRAQQSVSDAAYALQRSHQAVRDAEYQVSTASAQLQTAQQNLSTAQDATSHSFDLNTEAGRRNLGQLYTLADAINAEFGPTAIGYSTMIGDVASSFGISKQAAADMLAQLKLIPADWRFGVTAVAQVDLTPLQNFKGQGGYFKDGFRSAGGQLGFAEGGHVRGPGGPRSDVIDARLSNNEFVQPSDSVDYYGVGFMEAVRQKQIPKFASGGLVAGNFFGAGAGVGYMSVRNTATVMGAKNLPVLPQYVAPAVSFGPVAGVSGDRAGNKAIVQQVFASMFGWTGPQWEAATRLIMGESGFNNMAQNPTSSAFGMFQFLNPTWGGYGIPKTSDPTQQAIAGGRYISARYGSPLGAWNAWSSRSPHWYADGGLVDTKRLTSSMYGGNKPGSYDNGGSLKPGWNLAYNGTGKPENVRTSSAEDRLLTELRAVKDAVQEMTKMTMRGEVTLDGKRLLGEVKGAFTTLTTEAGF
jgi:hypothetical protein